MIGVDVLPNGVYRVIGNDVQYKTEAEMPDGLLQKVFILLATDELVHVPGVGKRRGHLLLIQEGEDDSDFVTKQDHTYLTIMFKRHQEARKRGNSTGD